MNEVLAIVPSLNPDAKLLDVLRGLLDAGFAELVLVNDGSGAAAEPIFAEAAQLPGVTLLRHEENRGKGCALKTAFRWCLAERPGCAGVVTVDGDGQHRPADVLRVAEAMCAAQAPALWLGARDFSLPDVPKKSLAGNVLTRTVLRIACGVRVSDSQTGLRGFPRALLPMLLEVRGERFEYETEMLLEAQRRGVPIRETKIETVYLEENRSSHYRPLQDSLRISRIILRYLSSSLCGFLVDQGVFALVNLLLAGRWADGTRLFAATAAARVCSSLLNYALNRSFVFRDSGKVGRSMARYYLLAAAQMALSYALVRACSVLLGATVAGESGIKPVVDLLLFFVSYRVQQRWVFRP